MPSENHSPTKSDNTGKEKTYHRSLSRKMREIVDNLTAPHRHRNKFCNHCKILENKVEFTQKYKLSSYDPKELDNFVLKIKQLNEQLYQEYE